MYVFLIIFIILIFLDIVWLSFAWPRVYLPGFHKVGKIRSFGYPTLILALITYFLLAYGIRFYALEDVENKTINKVITEAALLGFISYSVYNLTNLAVFEDYSTIMALIDIIWGTFLTTTTSLITLYIIK